MKVIVRNFELRSEEHTSELQSQSNLVCRPLLEKTGCELLAITPIKAVLYLVVFRVRRRSRVCIRDPRVTGSRTRWGRRSVRRLVFFNDTATTEIYSLSLHDALPI